jgi:hypothetical protein
MTGLTVRASRDKFSQITHRPPLPYMKYSWKTFSQSLSRLQGHGAAGSFKSKTQFGIEPATFQLVAQCLNQLRHRVPPLRIRVAGKWE